MSELENEVAACPDRETLQSYLLGLVGGDDGDQLDQHVSTCDSCIVEARSIVADDELTGAIRNARTHSQAESDTVNELVERIRKLRVESSDSHHEDTVSVDLSELDSLNGPPAERPLKPSLSVDVPVFLAPPEEPDEIGRLGDYRILEILGAGGMGVVLGAEDTKLKRTVAIKAMLPEIAARKNAKKRFMREAQATAAIEHDNIVTIYQVAEDRGAPFLAMQFLRGESLEDRLRKIERFDDRETLRIGREIATGLSAAHAQGLLHRDIKPDNIWLEEGTDRVKIVDFGLARIDEGEDSQLTQSGAVVGTPKYMAPEQAMGEQVDHRCDLFSLGSVLYRLTTGEAPFQGTNVTATLIKVANDDPKPVHDSNPHATPALVHLIDRLLQKEPDLRLQSADEVVAAIRQIESDSAAMTSEQSAVVVPQPSTEKKNGRPIFVGTAIAGLLVVVLGVILMMRTPTGTLRIEVNDPNLTVFVDGEEITLTDNRWQGKRKAEKHRLAIKLGDQQLGIGESSVFKVGGRQIGHHVTAELNDFEVTSNEFEIVRGEETVLRISLEKKAVTLTLPSDRITPSGVSVGQADRLFIHPGGYFIRGLDNDWFQKWDDGWKPPNLFREVRRTKEFVEMRHRLIPVTYRLYQDKSLIKDDRKRGAEFVKRHDGQWMRRTDVADRSRSFWLQPHGYFLQGLENDWFEKWNDGKTEPNLFQETQRTEEFVELRHRHLPVKFRLYDDSAFGLNSRKDETEFTLRYEGKWQPKLGGRVNLFDDNAPPLAKAPFTADEAKEHQQAWADYLGLPVEKEVDISNGEKMAFMLIPPGEFMMGSTAEEQQRFLQEAKAANDQWAVYRIPSEGPQHRVRVTRPVYLGKYEVTQAQWQSVMEDNPPQFKDNPTHPVEKVSWNDIQLFLTKLNEGASAAEMKFALPSEAQWEYACRAGTTKVWHSGDSEVEFSQYGWFNGNSGGKTHPVGQLRPNAYGLYDLHGNVWEWCADWYGADYYTKAAVDDPSGPSTGSDRVLRGACWKSHAGHCRSAIRYRSEPGRRSHNLGFRLAMTFDVDNQMQVKTAENERPADGLRFDGETSYVRVPTFKYDGKHPLTVEAIVTPEVQDAASVVSSFNYGGYRIYVSKGRWHAGIHCREKVNLGTDEPPVTHRRTHLALVFNGKQVSFFVDGKLRNSDEVVGDYRPPRGNIDLFLGADAHNDTGEAVWSFLGDIHQVRFSAAVLYTKDFTAPTEFAKGSDTLALYRLDEGSGRVAHDSSGNDHHGSIHSATWIRPANSAAIIRQAQTIAATKTLVGHTGTVRDVVFSPDDKTLVSGSYDGTIRIWDVATAKEQAVLRGHSDFIYSLAIAADGKTLISGGRDKRICIWDLERGQLVRKLPVQGHFIYAVAIDPNGERIAWGTSGGGVFVQSLAEEKTAALPSHKDGVRTVRFSADGARFLTASYDGTVRVYDLENVKEPTVLDGHDGRAHDAAFGPNGTVFSCGDDLTFRQWDVESLQDRILFRSKGPRFDTFVVIDGKYVAIASEESVVVVHDLATGKELHRFAGHTGMTMALAATPDGRTLAAACKDKTIRLWDVGEIRGARVGKRKPPLAAAPSYIAMVEQHQKVWAKHLGVPAGVTNEVGMRLRLIPSGTFQTSATNGDQIEKPVHDVTITEP